jgi:hypothetical protein
VAEADTALNTTLTPLWSSVWSLKNTFPVTVAIRGLARSSEEKQNNMLSDFFNMIYPHSFFWLIKNNPRL